MGILQFIAAILDSLAWPVAVFALAVLVREPLGKLLLTITKLKYKDLELDFGRELKEIEQVAKSIKVLPTPKISKQVGGPKDTTELLEEAEQLASDFPEPSVAVAWSAVESVLISVGEQTLNDTAVRRWTPGEIIKLLQEKEILDSQTVDVLRRMQNLRNIAVHERWNAFGGITPDEAIEFIALARGMNGKLIHIAG